MSAVRSPNIVIDELGQEIYHVQCDKEQMFTSTRNFLRRIDGMFFKKSWLANWPKKSGQKSS